MKCPCVPDNGQGINRGIDGTSLKTHRRLIADAGCNSSDGGAASSGPSELLHAAQRARHDDRPPRRLGRTAPLVAGAVSFALARRSGRRPSQQVAPTWHRAPARPAGLVRTGCASAARSLSISRRQYRRCDRVCTAAIGKGALEQSLRYRGDEASMTRQRRPALRLQSLCPHRKQCRSGPGVSRAPID
jgi:hypothetical protein